MNDSDRSKTVGILGGGQLGRMLALAGTPLGLDFIFLDNSGHSSTKNCWHQIRSEYTSENIIELSTKSNVITYEFEHLPIQELIDAQKNGANFSPSLKALEITQDRLLEKENLKSLGIPVTQFSNIESLEQLIGCVKEYNSGFLKTRKFGYDGKGQIKIQSIDDCKSEKNITEIENFIKHGAIFEKACNFLCEMSVIGVFSDTESVFYTPTFNTHKDGILNYSTTKTPCESLERRLESIIHKTKNFLTLFAKATNYRGVVTFEFFVTDTEILANEIAPRVHNSGHWTIEGSVTSQFENHIRAICGLPLGSTDLTGKAAHMFNIIGNFINISEVLKIPTVKIHNYNKQEKIGRKLGHITLIDYHSKENGISIDDSILKLSELTS